MKKLLLLVPVVLLFAVMMPAPSRAGGAVVLHTDGACFVYDGDGGIFATVCEKSDVITPNGTTNHYAKAQVPPPSSGGAARFNFDNTGDICFVIGVGGTDDWQEVVSASGNMTLICKFH